MSSPLVVLLKNSAVTLALPLVKSVGKAELELALDSLATKEGEPNFDEDLKAAYNAFKRLDGALKANSVAEGIVSTIVTAFEEEAAKKNISLN